MSQINILNKSVSELSVYCNSIVLDVSTQVSTVFSCIEKSTTIKFNFD